MHKHEVEKLRPNFALTLMDNMYKCRKAKDDFAYLMVHIRINSGGRDVAGERCRWRRCSGGLMLLLLLLMRCDVLQRDKSCKCFFVVARLWCLAPSLKCARALYFSARSRITSATSHTIEERQNKTKTHSREPPPPSHLSFRAPLALNYSPPLAFINLLAFPAEMAARPD